MPSERLRVPERCSKCRNPLKNAYERLLGYCKRCLDEACPNWP